MQRFKGYLIVSDLDGTLINSEQYVSELNMEAISYFTREGGYFAVATGRTELNMLPFAEGLSINCPCIIYNGSAIYDLKKKQFIKSTFLDKEKLIQPLKIILSEHKNLCMQIFTQGNLFVVSSAETIDPVIVREKQAHEMAELEDVLKEDWVKIILRDTNDVLRGIEQFLKGCIGPGVFDSVFSTATYLELLAPGISKGSALEELIKIMRVERQRTIAIGDYSNDLEMIRAVGLGVATANAHQDLKNAANVTTVSNDEHAIHNLIHKVLPEYQRKLKGQGNHFPGSNYNMNGNFSG